MAEVFELTVINPQEIIYQGRVVSMVAPCSLGYLGVLANHFPLIAKLVKGKIIIREESGKSTILHSESPGFLEVLNNKVNMILQQA
jgi:F-type H+-transporting ATPase subunit epsilon